MSTYWSKGWPASFRILCCLAAANATSKKAGNPSSLPRKGFDYVFFKQASQVIFDFTDKSGLTDVIQDVQWARPRSVAQITQDTDCSMTASTSTFSSDKQFIQSLATDAKQTWNVGGSAGLAGQELAGSVGNTKGKFQKLVADKQQRSSSEFVRLSSKCTVGTVTMVSASRAVFDPNFINDVSLLDPSLTWTFDNFIGSYGTHYMQEAYLGGSYESVHSKSTCSLKKQHETIQEYSSSLKNNFKPCATVPAGTLTGVAPGLLNVKACGNTGSSGQNSDKKSGKGTSNLNSQMDNLDEVWLGGSGKLSGKAIRTHLDQWIQDITQYPHAFPKKLSALSDLLITIARVMQRGGKLAKACPGCQAFASVGETSGSLMAKGKKLESAMFDYFKKHLPSSKCKNTCGICNLPPEPKSCSCEPVLKRVAGSCNDKMKYGIKLHVKLLDDTSADCGWAFHKSKTCTTSWDNTCCKPDFKLEVKSLGQTIQQACAADTNDCKIDTKLMLTKQDSITVTVWDKDSGWMGSGFFGQDECVGSCTMTVSQIIDNPECVLHHKTCGKQRSTLQGTLKFMYTTSPKCSAFPSKRLFVEERPPGEDPMVTQPSALVPVAFGCIGLSATLIMLATVARTIRSRSQPREGARGFENSKYLNIDAAEVQLVE